VIAAGFTLRVRREDPPAAPKTVANDSVLLNVQREGERLKLLWDPATMPNATQAELYITDGNHQSKLSLNSALFAAGSFSYIPITQDVAFRLETPGGRSIAGSVKPRENIEARPSRKGFSRPPNRKQTVALCDAGGSARSAGEGDPSTSRSPGSTTKAVRLYHQRARTTVPSKTGGPTIRAASVNAALEEIFGSPGAT
jgi:hypothetical protein